MAKTKADQRREELREQVWPGSAARIWKGPAEKGYWCAPRILPLLLHITSDQGLVGTKDCSKVYLDLLSRDFGQGVVEIRDEDEQAFCSGYISPRARRTWQERIRALEDIGLIEVTPKGNRLIGYILLVHPTIVVEKLRQRGKLSDTWWHLYQQQLRDTGASSTAPTVPLSAPDFRVIEGGATNTDTLNRTTRRKRALE